jgi:hypothetical protein
VGVDFFNTYKEQSSCCSLRPLLAVFARTVCTYYALSPSMPYPLQKTRDPEPPPKTTLHSVSLRYYYSLLDPHARTVQLECSKPAYI